MSTCFLQIAILQKKIRAENICLKKKTGVHNVPILCVTLAPDSHPYTRPQQSSERLSSSTFLLSPVQNRSMDSSSSIHKSTNSQPCPSGLISEILIEQLPPSPEFRCSVCASSLRFRNMPELQIFESVVPQLWHKLVNVHGVPVSDDIWSNVLARISPRQSDSTTALWMSFSSASLFCSCRNLYFFSRTFFCPTTKSWPTTAVEVLCASATSSCCCVCSSSTTFDAVLALLQFPTSRHGLRSS